MVSAERARRSKDAWLSYLAIQVLWAALILLTPMAASLHPSKFWALPFSGITMVNGLHLTYYRREYDVLMKRLAASVPFTQRFASTRYAPEYYLPLGVGYTLFGVLSAILIVLY